MISQSLRRHTALLLSVLSFLVKAFRCGACIRHTLVNNVLSECCGRLIKPLSFPLFLSTRLFGLSSRFASVKSDKTFIYFYHAYPCSHEITDK